MVKKLNKNENIILELISKKNELTIKNIEEEISIERRTAQRALKSLSENGLIEAIGTTKDRSYRRVFLEKEALFNYIVFSSGVMVGELHFGSGEYIFNYDENTKVKH